MAKFRDCKGREWILTITNGDIKPVRDRTGIELNKLLGNKDQFAELLFGDSLKLGELIWVLCEEQVSKLGISELDFGRGFDGPTIEAAQTAVMEAVADFSPRSPVGQAIKKGWARILKEMDARAVEQVEAAVEQVISTLNQSSTTLPASSASIQAP